MIAGMASLTQSLDDVAGGFRVVFDQQDFHRRQSMRSNQIRRGRCNRPRRHSSVHSALAQQLSAANVERDEALTIVVLDERQHRLAAILTRSFDGIGNVVGG